MRSRSLVRVLICSLALGAGNVSPARAADNVDFIARLKSVTDDLNFTGDTKSKVDSILTKAKDDADKAQSDAGDDRRAAYGKTSQIMRNAAVEIMSLLDEDQKGLFRNKMRAAVASNTMPAAAQPVTMTQRIKDALAPLKLSDDQNMKANAVIEELQKKADDIHSAGIGPEIPQQMQTLREDGLKQLKTILTEEQFKKFQENIGPAPQADRPGQAEAGGRIGMTLQRFHDATKELGLSSDQQTKVDAAFAETMKKFTELLPQLKTGATPEFTEKMRGIFQDLRKELATALTSEQLEKLKFQMQQRPAAPK